MGCSTSSQPPQGMHSRSSPPHARNQHTTVASYVSGSQQHQQAYPAAQHQQGSYGSNYPSQGYNQNTGYQPAMITRDLLMRYVDLEKRINYYEGMHVGQNLLVQTNQLKYLREKLAVAEQQLKELKATSGDAAKKQSAKECARELLRVISQSESDMTPDQEEALEVLSVQDLMESTIYNVQQQEARLNKEVARLRQDANELNRLYQEQESLMASIFQGRYGSQQEMQIEQELDNVTRQYNMQVAVKQRWQAARLLMYYACCQIGVACTRWSTLMRMGMANLGQQPLRYSLATETRDNLNAAIINVASAQDYLSNILFPYCKPEEMHTLKMAATNIYSDMQQPERQQHAMSCYQSCYQRSYALIQWIDVTIDKYILKEVEKVGSLRRELDRKLRTERVRLLQEKLRQDLGGTVDIDLDRDGNFADAEELRRELAGADETSRIPVAVSGGATDDKLLTQGGQTKLQQQMSGGSSSSQAPSAPPEEVHKVVERDAQSSGSTEPADVPRAPSALPLHELAPPPSGEQLFGSVAAIQKQHEQQVDDYTRAQAADRSRTERDLQEKLAARKSRRNRNAGLVEE